MPHVKTALLWCKRSRSCCLLQLNSWWLGMSAAGSRMCSVTVYVRGMGGNLSIMYYYKFSVWLTNIFLQIPMILVFEGFKVIYLLVRYVMFLWVLVLISFEKYDQLYLRFVHLLFTIGSFEIEVFQFCLLSIVLFTGSLCMSSFVIQFPMHVVPRRAILILEFWTFSFSTVPISYFVCINRSFRIIVNLAQWCKNYIYLIHMWISIYINVSVVQCPELIVN